jgi:WD repeat-containing protein 45
MDRRDFRLINAHNTQVTALALSLNGSRLATASEKGTLIRVFETSNGTKLQELRRGSDPADVYHLAFDRKSMWLAVTSDKNTVHVFAIREKNAESDQRPVRRIGSKGSSAPAAGHAGSDAVVVSNPGSWFTIAQVCAVDLLQFARPK